MKASSEFTTFEAIGLALLVIAGILLIYVSASGAVGVRVPLVLHIVGMSLGVALAMFVALILWTPTED